MPTLESIDVTGGAYGPRRDRFSGWKFWLIALLLHVLFLAVFAQLYILVIKPQSGLVAIGPQGIEVNTTVAPPTPPVREQRDVPVQPVANPVQPLPVITTPDFNIPAPIPQVKDQVMAFMPQHALPSVGVPRQWAGRVGRPGDKQRWIQAGHGDPKIEDAVLRALRWLKRTQNENGSWSNRQPVAMTGMALLAFLAHGDTPASREFGETVRRAIAWLHEQAEKGNGKVGSRVEYETGIATYALAEAFGMTGDPKLRPVVEKCVETIINGQTDGGGWVYGYAKGGLGDMSISGWQVQALKTAYLAGIKQKEIADSLDKAMTYTKKVYGSYKGAPDKGGFGYRGPQCQWTLTGTGLLCLLFWEQGGSQEAQAAAKFLREEVAFGIGKDLEGKIGGKNNLYGYYYITQAMFLVDAPNGPNWRYWNSQFSNALVETQIKGGDDDGKFPHGDWGQDAVYNTALSTLMLTVYYRNLPGQLTSMKR